jgi:carbon-monoxide dehydrogenase medium subunit
MSEYVYPSSIEEAVACLERHPGEGRVIAGGTDLLPDLRKGRIAPRCLVDITRIPGLRQIEVDGGGVTVGAGVTFAALRKHRFLCQHVHALVDAAASVGAGAIQNAATWVGNIVQAMPAADGAIIALALDAEAEIVNRDGARWEPVGSLFAGPGRSTIDPTSEIISRLRFSGPWTGVGTAWRRVGRRAALVLPILNCAVRVELETASAGEETVSTVAIALGPVAPRPYRARRAETFLRGRPPRTDVLSQTAKIAQSEANPRTSVTRASAAYRRDILPTLVEDALREAVGRAGGRP